jgi:hypothetical protein
MDALTKNSRENLETPRAESTDAPGESPVVHGLDYFEMGSEFFNKNYVLLGYHVTDASQSVGELEPMVAEALNELAVATAERMVRIMEDDL